MDKILLSTKDIEYLLKWRDEHQDLVRRHDCPIRAVKIVCTESGFVLTAIREKRELSISVTQNGVKTGKLLFEMMPFGMLRLTKNKTRLPQDDVQSVLTVYCSLMAMLVHGGYRDETAEPEKEKKAPNKNKGGSRPKKKTSGITYILHTKSGVRIAPQGSHKSPSGTFSVRGHYRRYKSGKVIWIDEYTKGDGRKKAKVYKLGLKGDEKNGIE